MTPINWPADAKLVCAVRRCGGDLVTEQTHTQDGTGDRAATTRCSKNARHRFFIVERVGKLIPLVDDTRWKRRA